LIAKMEIQRRMEKAGAYQTGAVSPSGIEYLQEIRDICKGNTCRQYGKTWACPPAVGTIEECKAACISCGKCFNSPRHGCFLLSESVKQSSQNERE
jgi:predicted metal-binding protein